MPGTELLARRSSFIFTFFFPRRTKEEVKEGKKAPAVPEESKAGEDTSAKEDTGEVKTYHHSNRITSSLYQR